MGGAVAEWSKALLMRENKQKTKKIPGSPPDLAPFFKLPTYDEIFTYLHGCIVGGAKLVH